MRELNEYLKSHPDLVMFVRYNPIWYRYLSRDPHNIHEMTKEANKFFEKTFSQRIEKVNDQIQKVEMLIALTKAMKD